MKKKTFKPKNSSIKTIKNSSTNILKKENTKSIMDDFHANISNMEYKNLAPLVCSIISSSSLDSTNFLSELVKIYTNKKLKSTDGILTCTVSKQSRISFKNVKYNLNEYIDASKISDIVVFVLENKQEIPDNILEFVSMLKSHGFPKVLVFLQQKTDKIDKKLKNKLYDVLAPGIKITTDILKLSRNLSVMKPRPIEFKCTYPFVLVDKVEDGFLHGYLRGTLMRKNMNVHLPGVGDTIIEEIEVIDDPCPFPTGKMLSIKKKKLYAPLNVFEKVESKLETEKTKSLFGQIEKTEKLQIFDQGTKLLDVQPSTESEEELEQEEEVEQEKSMEFEQESLEGDVEAFVKRDLHLESSNETETKEDNEIKEIKEEISENFIKPGQYVKFKISNNFTHTEKNSTEQISTTKTFSNSELGKILTGRLKNKILLIGGLKKQENISTCVVKFFRNKNFHKMLKSNDPVICSVGWRRLQVIPVFSMSVNIGTERNRYIRRTPLGLHCYSTFMAPTSEIGTPVSFYRTDSTFKMAGTGKIYESQNFKIYKKLKIVGFPTSIKMNSVIISGMFNSNLEVEKFRGAKIETSSSLRGIVKAPVQNSGNFRATFEGKISEKDVVVLKTWILFEPIYGFVNYDGEEVLRLRRQIFEANKVDEDSEEEIVEEVKNKKQKEKKKIVEKFKIPRKFVNKVPFEQKKVVEKKTGEFVSLEDRQYLQKQKEFNEKKNTEKILKQKEVKEKIENEKEEKIRIKKIGVQKNIINKKFKKRVKKGKR